MPWVLANRWPCGRSRPAGQSRQETGHGRPADQEHALRRQETGFGQGLGPGEREAVPEGDLARGQPRQTEFALLGHTGGNGAWLVARTRPRQRSLALGGVARRGERTDQVLLM